MKELSVVEMNEVSGAGWDLIKGAGLGVLSGMAILSLISSSIKNPVDFDDTNNANILGSSMAIGILSAFVSR